MSNAQISDLERLRQACERIADACKFDPQISKTDILNSPEPRTMNTSHKSHKRNNKYRKGKDLKRIVQYRLLMEAKGRQHFIPKKDRCNICTGLGINRNKLSQKKYVSLNPKYFDCVWCDGTGRR